MNRMNRRLMGCAFGIAASLLGMGAASCGTHEASATQEQLEPLSGSVRLPLVTPTREQFRLRGASFEIRRANGDLAVTLDSESDPDATALSADLDTGAYEITLRDGWSLERLGDAGGPVGAALLTANPLPFAIENSRVTEVVYRFATESGIVTFGSGELSVSVDVTEHAPSAQCGLLDPFSCPAGQTCLFSGEGGGTFCAVPGSLPVGTACGADQCVAGAQCLALDAANPGARSCAQFCSTSSPSFGCDCRALAFDDEVGICVTPAGCTGVGCGEDVLVAGAPGLAEWNDDVRTHLLNTGAFASVDVFDTQLATPALEQLQQYDAVLVFSDASFADSTALGDNLATYFDAGGRVVVATFANASVPLGGRWGFENYQLVDPVGQDQPPEGQPLILLEPGSPLVADVVSLTAQSAFRSLGQPINGGVVVAAWGSGAPLIVRGEKNGRARADLNMYPPSSEARSDLWVGSGAEIMRNALLFR